MMMALPDNPIYDRLTHNSKRPSLRVCLWIGFVLGLITLAVMGRAVFSLGADSGDGLSWALIFASAALAAFSPPVAAITAVATATLDVCREEYTLMRLTNISAGQIVRGYFFAALFRLRILLTLVVGTMPALVLGILILNVRWTLLMFNIREFVGYDGGYIVGLTGPIPWRPSAATGPLMMFLALAVGLWGTILLGTAVGTALALWWRRLIGASVSAGILMLFPGPLIAIGVLGQVPLLLTPDIPFRAAPFMVTQIVVASLALLIPYLLAFGVVRLARRWV